MTTLDITCVTLVGLATRYLEQDLPEQEQLNFELHLVLCPKCFHHLDKRRRTVRAIGALAGEPIQPERRNALIEAFSSRNPSTG